MDNTYFEFIEEISSGVETQAAQNAVKLLKENDINNLDAVKMLINMLNDNDMAHELFCILSFSITILLVFNVLTNLFKSNQVLRICVKITASISIILPIYRLLSVSTEYMRDISFFIGVLTPTVGIITAAGGNVFSAEMQSVSFSVLTVISQAFLNWILPIVISFFITISVIDLFGKEGRMLAFSNFTRNFFFSIYALFIAIIFLIFNFYNSAAQGEDTISSKAFRLIVGQSIPIIGGTVGEAIKLLGGGIVRARNVIGLSSVVFILGTCVSYIPTLLAYGFIINLAAHICDYFSITELKSTLIHLKNAIEFVLATLSVIVILIFINLGVFMNTIPLMIQ